MKFFCSSSDVTCVVDVFIALPFRGATGKVLHSGHCEELGSRNEPWQQEKWMMNDDDPILNLDSPRLILQSSHLNLGMFRNPSGYRICQDELARLGGASCCVAKLGYQ